MNVRETKLDIAMKSGKADAILYTPEGEGPFPGVLHLPDIFSIRPGREEMARRQAEQGYVVLLPNVFWRVCPAPTFDFMPEFGAPRTTARLNDMRKGLTPDQMSEDAPFYLDLLAAQPKVKQGKLGVVGYCFTGAMAMRMAAAAPDQVACAASFHGGGLAIDDASSPHRLLPQIKARLYFGHATQDKSMPPEMIETLETALKKWGGVYESETYEGALHGWTIKGPMYNEAQGERHFKTLMTLLRETLG
jgi:carboxymethylenebutenolidase